MDPVVHAEMTHVVAREQALRREAAQIKEDGPIWEKRLEMAQSHGRDDLIEIAEGKLAELRQRIHEIRNELEIIQEEKRMLRQDGRRADSGGDAANARAEALLEDFKQLGIDPEQGKLDRAVRDAELDDELAALRAKMGED